MTLTGILSYLAFINLTGFAVFGIDKYKAIHHKWRIRESALFAIAILGGSVGCLIGMYVFHHKTLHPSFRIGIPMILIVELIAGCLCFYTISNRTPYRQDPVKVVRHELSSLSAQKESDIVKTLNVHDVFPSADTKQSVPSDITSVFADFFHDFSYHIRNFSEQGNSASVTVSLTTPDGEALAKEYSRQVMIKQIQNSASPASVDFSLEDCYLLLGNVLKNNDYKSLTSDYTITLTRSGKTWNIDSPKSLSAAVTGNFSTYVADASLFSPSEIIAIHLDTLKAFDTEQLNRYLALDSLFNSEDTSSRSVVKAIASQLLNCLDYSITSELLSDDGMDASVDLNLTSCDFSSVIYSYQEQYTAYLASSQALEDGTERPSVPRHHSPDRLYRHQHSNHHHPCNHPPEQRRQKLAHPQKRRNHNRPPWKPGRSPHHYSHAAGKLISDITCLSCHRQLSSDSEHSNLSH